MKRILAMLFLICCLLFPACFSNKTGGYTHPDFKTEYTEEEHVQKITEKTKELFSEEFSRGAIKSYNVEIVYAFYDNDPEYFLVELEYTEKFPGVLHLENEETGSPYTQIYTKYKHFIGYIKKDNYYTTTPYNDGFMFGKSAWNYLGYNENKKYYGGRVQGVETENKILRIYDGQYAGITESVEFIAEEYGYKSEWDSQKAFRQIYLSEEEQRYYMGANYNMFPLAYEELIEGGHTPPRYLTAYTQEEHEARITAITQDLYADEIENGQIVNVEVEIVFSIKEQYPEYFLVEIEYDKAYPQVLKLTANEEKVVNTKYMHLIGVIENEEYYTTKYYNDGFMLGRSSWKYLGYGNEKKYYGGGMNAIKTEYGWLGIYKNDEYTVTNGIYLINSAEYSALEYGYVPKFISEDVFRQLEIYSKDNNENLREKENLERIRYRYLPR